MRPRVLAAVAAALCLVTTPSASAYDLVENNLAAVSAGAGDMTLYARGDNGRLHTKTWINSASSWTDWIDLGGMELSSGPGAQKRSDGTTDVFARGTDNAVYHRYYTPTTQWTRWGSLGGCASSAPASTQRYGTVNIDLFVRGCDGQLWTRTWTGSSWSQWASFHFPVEYSPAVISRADGPLSVYVVGTDHQLYETVWNGTSWSSFLPLGGYLTSAPSVISQSPGKYDVFARDANNNIAQRSWNGTTWSSWVVIPTVATSAPAAASEVDGRVNLYVRGGSQIYYNMWQQPTWNGWVPWGPSAAPVPFTTGLAQDTALATWNVFASTHFAPLGQARLKYRVIADYNAVTSGDLPRVRGLIDAAYASGAEVLVSLRKPAGQSAPTSSDYASGVRALFTAVGPKVRYWGTWNEPSLTLPKPPTGPTRLAQYYGTLKSIVGVNNTVGPEFLDKWSSSYPAVHKSDAVDSELQTWVSQYISAGGGFGVAAAFHPYGAITRMNAASLQTYLSALPQNTHVWLTEAGALVSRDGTVITVDGVPVTEAEQEKQVQFLLHNLAGARAGTRIVDRIYYYALRGDYQWDTGLLDQGGTARRPSWATFCSYTFSTDPSCN